MRGVGQIVLSEFAPIIGGVGSQLRFKNRAAEKDDAVHSQWTTKAHHHRRLPAELAGGDVDGCEGAPGFAIAGPSIRAEKCFSQSLDGVMLLFPT